MTYLVIDYKTQTVLVVSCWLLFLWSPVPIVDYHSTSSFYVTLVRKCTQLSTQAHLYLTINVLLFAAHLMGRRGGGIELV